MPAGYLFVAEIGRHPDYPNVWQLELGWMLSHYLNLTKCHFLLQRQSIRAMK